MEIKWDEIQQPIKITGRQKQFAAEYIGVWEPQPSWVFVGQVDLGVNGLLKKTFTELDQEIRESDLCYLAKCSEFYNDFEGLTKSRLDLVIDRLYSDKNRQILIARLTHLKSIEPITIKISGTSFYEEYKKKNKPSNWDVCIWGDPHETIEITSDMSVEFI